MLGKKHRYVFESVRTFSESGKENPNEANISWDLVSTVALTKYFRHIYDCAS